MNDTLEPLQNDINVLKKNIARVYKPPHYDTDVWMKILREFIKYPQSNYNVPKSYIVGVYKIAHNIISILLKKICGELWPLQYNDDVFREIIVAAQFCHNILLLKIIFYYKFKLEYFC